MSGAPGGPASHRYVSQRLRLHYVDWGNEAAPPLLMVHGGRDHCRNWDWLAQALRGDWHIVAPDLRGHGDSQWLIGGTYRMSDYVYDIAQLVHQTIDGPVSIVGHSLGGMIALRYAGLYPEKVRRVVAIEGLGPPPSWLAERRAKPMHRRLTDWIEEVRGLSARLPRRYESLDAAWRRMHEENPHLSREQARHLTVHGVNRNEDGTYRLEVRQLRACVRRDRASGTRIARAVGADRLPGAAGSRRRELGERPARGRAGGAFPECALPRYRGRGALGAS